MRLEKTMSGLPVCRSGVWGLAMEWSMDKYDALGRWCLLAVMAVAAVSATAFST